MSFSTFAKANQLAEMGTRLAHQRVQRGWTQADLAKQAGVGKATIARLETGESTSLDTFLSVLNALNLTDNLDLLIPPVEVGPLDLLEETPPPRRRYRVRKPTATPAPTPWKWGDET